MQKPAKRSHGFSLSGYNHINSREKSDCEGHED